MINLKLSQRETFYPVITESGAFTTSIDMQIIRNIDGFYYDFNDQTFKDSTWTTKSVSLIEKTNGEWVYTSGWLPPESIGNYKAIFIDNGSITIPQSYDITVNSDINGLVVADAGNSVSSFKTDLTSNKLDYLKDRFLMVLDGVIAGEVKQIKGYNNSTKILTCNSFTEVLANGVKFDIF